MVAISLYRGNLHRVPDVPRRWLMPTPKISLKDFRILLNRRSRALARHHSSTATTSANPNPNPNPNEEDLKENNAFPNNDSLPPPQSDPPKITITTHPEEEDVGPLKEGACKEQEANDQKGSDGGDDGSVKPVDGSDASPADKKPQVPQSATTTNRVDVNANSQDGKPPEVAENPNAETSNKQDALSDKQKRIKEVEEKLQILNEKKHNLVKVLKQILNAEEELKRRNSMTRLGGDTEGGEADDASNHNMHSHHLLRMSSTSPSSDSPHRRPVFSALPHTPRASLAVASSPSRFAPTAHQGHPANLPTVSVSGTSYLVSSPSPAASGGTSAFRDGRLPSPWN